MLCFISDQSLFLNPGYSHYMISRFINGVWPVGWELDLVWTRAFFDDLITGWTHIFQHLCKSMHGSHMNGCPRTHQNWLCHWCPVAWLTWWVIYWFTLLLFQPRTASISGSTVSMWWTNEWAQAVFWHPCHYWSLPNLKCFCPLPWAFPTACSHLLPAFSFSVTWASKSCLRTSHFLLSFLFSHTTHTYTHTQSTSIASKDSVSSHFSVA